MGITGLWQILNSTSRPVTPESLENQILAVDVSIWMHQAVKGVRERRGAIPRTEDAHLLVMFHRICKLLHYRIKPIFVFDGTPPAVKQRQMERRRRIRNTAQEKVQKLSVKLLENLVQQQAVGNAIGVRTGRITASQSSQLSQPSSQVAVTSGESSSRDMFALPARVPKDENDSEDERDVGSSGESDNEIISQPSTSSQMKVNYDKVDINSADFKSMPPEIRHEILTELQQARRKPSWKHIDQLPEDSEQFSSFQIKRLMKRSAVQQSLRDTAREMNSRRTGAICAQVGNKLKETDTFNVDARKIASTENSHYLLLTRRNSKTTLGSSEENTNDSTDTAEEAIVSSKPVKKLPPEVFVVSSDEDENDLQILDSVIRASLETKPVAPVVFELAPPEDISDEADVSVSDSSFHIPLSLVSQQFVPQRSAHVNRALQLSGHPPSKSKEKKQGVLVDEAVTAKKPLSKKVAEITILDSPEKADRAAEESKAEKSVDSVVLTVDEEKPEAKEVRVATPTKTSFPPSIQLPLRTPVSIAFDHESSWGDFSSPRLAGSRESSDSEDDFEVVADEEVLSVSPIRRSPLPAQSSQAEVPSTSQASVESMPEAMQAIVAADHADFHNEALDESFLEIDLEAVEAATLDQEQNTQPELSVQELQNLQTHLETQARSLYGEQKKEERMANSVSDQLRIECQELLRLFGIPYINSPSEAEAQCACMDRTKQTHGTITDDSDVWAFGARKVYKNFFNSKKYIECFDIENIQSQVAMTKEKIIAFALLTGSDYTEGIEGVGGIRALEILAEFGGGGVETLQEFKKWWDKTQRRRRKGDKRPENKLRAQLAELSIPDIFPDDVVVQAYLDPEVDNSTETFTWDVPALDLLREYTRKKFGFKQQQADEVLLPIIKRMNAKQETQTRLESYFTVQLKRPKVVMRSKRLGNAIDKIKGVEEVKQDDEGGLDGASQGPKEKKKGKAPAKKASKNTIEEEGTTKAKRAKPKAPAKRTRTDTVSSMDSQPSSAVRPRKRAPNKAKTKEDSSETNGSSQYF
ncbi:hypothetical protein RvY_13694 [Ramazzottius varieornatus]|uniref:XPG N-terminal domain-containing protein n=1 Tax=Ramazzottius varieornatus TaxID=947166 RepID=A0A1D1VNS3_RAMVA|nr:hypothetical protein RvY_13694 [Ramazzottius varieornatus]